MPFEVKLDDGLYSIKSGQQSRLTGSVSNSSTG